ncbi:hypothetical protein [Rhodohalobacter sp.]|uniref:hypothetical protein n=1 Tax=Rhodohalobacter sp. TaxID=1974210 RepID=UPI002ACE8F42|nr:hypothetical protein [Rhodohalobacter sp.]MDZ7757741.1 hypothetical protein [Rhodohalobacter sp.]
MRLHLKTLFSLILLALLLPGGVKAQLGSFFQESTLSERSLGGNISIMAGAYTVDGIENRRAPTILQTSANSNFSFLGLRSGFDLNYSTDESGLRQNMNKIGFNMRWRWLQLEAGDVNPNFSTYGLSGARVRGGLLRVEPGNFLLELTGGRTQRAVLPNPDAGFRRPAFNQTAYAVKLGYGKQNSSYFHLSTFYAKDDVNSLGNQTLPITPQENITLTPDFQVLLFSGKLKLNSEVTVSYFTRDLNSSRIDIGESDIPDFLKGILQPRESSKLNYAGIANAELALDLFRLAMGYERIQPGFESLGRGTIRNDQETITLSPSVNLLNNRVRVSTSVKLGRDNLLGNRLQTQNNLNTNSSISYIISETVSLNGTYNFLLNRIENQSSGNENTTPDQSQISHNISIQPSFTFNTNSITHNISLNGGYIFSESDFGVRPGEGASDTFISESYSTNLNYVFTTQTGFSINSGVNFLTNDSDRNSIQNYGLTIGTGVNLFQNSLRVNLNGNVNKNRSEVQFSDSQLRVNELLQIGLNMNTTMNITDKDNLSLVVRGRSNRLQNGDGREFNELEGSINYRRRF